MPVTMTITTIMIRTTTILVISITVIVIVMINKLQLAELVIPNRLFCLVQLKQNQQLQTWFRFFLPFFVFNGKWLLNLLLNLMLLNSNR